MFAVAVSRSDAVAARNALFVANYEEVHQQAWRLALYLCGRREDAEDLLAEAVARAIRSFEKLRDPGAFHWWFLKLMRNLHLDHCRARKRQLDVADFGDDPVVWERLGRYPMLSGPQKKIEYRQVFRALDRLPESLRLPLALTALEGLSTAETAQIMGLTPTAVKVRVHRARKKLSEMLGADFEVER